MPRREQHFPEPSQQSGRGKTRSWLFGGWMSKNSEEESSHKDNSSSYSHIHDIKSSVGGGGGGGGGRPSSFDNEDPNTNHGVVHDPELLKKKKKITFAEVGDEHHAKVGNYNEVEGEKKDADEEVDKYAEDFIGKQKSKMEMERLISMKRYESMLNRGI